MMEVKIDDLRKVVLRILDHISETHKIDKVEIQSPYYWQVPEDKIYNMDAILEEMDVGNLNDDWDFVSNLLDDREQPLANQLTEVAPLLRYVGEILGKSTAARGG